MIGEQLHFFLHAFSLEYSILWNVILKYFIQRMLILLNGCKYRIQYLLPPTKIKICNETVRLYNDFMFGCFEPIEEQFK